MPDSKRHFIIVEVETPVEQPSKAVEDKMVDYFKAAREEGVEPEGVHVKSLGWIADNVREAPTGKQKI